MQLILEGALPEGWTLSRPLEVELLFDGIDEDDGEWIVSDPAYHLHSSAPLKDQAIISFRRQLVGQLALLSKHDGALGSQLQEELAYLRELVVRSNAEVVPGTKVW